MSKPANEDRRRQIMEAALPIFATKGFQGTTNRDIAHAAKIAPGLIYWYFKSKEDLFIAIVDEFMPLARAASPLEGLMSEPPQAVLPVIASMAIQLIDEPTFLLVMRILAGESIRSPEMGQRLNVVIKRILDPLAAYIAAQQEAGMLRAGDPPLMAQLFLSSIAFFFIRRRIMQDAVLLGYDPGQVASFVVETFLRAFAT
jgi:AcrR family transcriptional regulator